jgi:multisubunit Na+/H+ antiporter MnhB subunit
MPIREHTAQVALRGGLIGLVACALATTIYLGVLPRDTLGAPAGGATRPAMMALPVGLGGGVLLAWVLHLRRPWVVGVAGLVLSVAGALAAFVVIYRMLDMSEPMQQHPAWPFGVLMIVVAGCYAWAAVLAEPATPPEPRHRRYR